MVKFLVNFNTNEYDIPSKAMQFKKKLILIHASVVLS